MAVAAFGSAPAQTKRKNIVLQYFSGNCPARLPFILTDRASVSCQTNHLKLFSSAVGMVVVGEGEEEDKLEEGEVRWKGIRGAKGTAVPAASLKPFCTFFPMTLPTELW